MHLNFLCKFQRIPTCVCIVAGLLLCLLFFFTETHFMYVSYDNTEIPIPQPIHEALPCHANPLCFISPKRVLTWNEKDFLIVFGIPSLDIPKRQWRRRMQRVTCWQFPEVATRHNNFTGAFLPLYLLARHPTNNFSFSAEMVDEAEQWQDIIIHPMSEEKITTNKMNDGKGYWGIQAEIGSSRKTFFWFSFAFRQFPRVPFIAKGDDDMFLRVPQYLTDLRLFPRSGLYWGRTMQLNIPKYGNSSINRVLFNLGFCVTLARDVAKQVVSYKPLQRVASLPYSKELEPEFRFFTMQHEDVMVGRALQLTGYPFIMFSDDGERFHKEPNQPLTKNFVVTHVPPEDEYYFLMKKTLVNATTTQSTVIEQIKPLLFRVSHPAEQK